MDEAAARQERRWSRLMRKAQDGEPGAYVELLREIVPFIRALAVRKLAQDEVEDLVQDVLLSLHRVRHSYDPGRPFTPWLAAIAGRRVVDALRRKIRRQSHELQDEGAYETFADPDANKDAEAGETAQLVGALVESLPKAQREALELVKLKEMSLAEASAASGQSVGALKVGVHRAIKALRLKMGLSE
jgi:RNA polymerase sigma-70 factor (ECF subfamily)